MKSLIMLFGFGLILLACDTNEVSNNTSSETDELIVENPVDSSTFCFDTSSDSPYTAVTFEKGKNDWGYKIMNGEALLINQPHIPAVQGNSGFSSKEKALITGNYMIYKLDAGILPPTVSLEELDSLGVLD
ncbi:MAG: DUF4907 domain-containing protein [Crocinitomix sp.]|nr:DUF4907 domain-containing protein [Crocinitomix sp.]|tara:strand:+ start:446 stop:838 length:393 start_codon:yes stop_codon:yes gene_type:complete